MDLTLNAVQLVGVAGAVCAVASFLMKKMLPLRLLALSSNGLLALYGYLTPDLARVLLNAGLVPVQLYWIREIRRTTAEMGRSNADTPVSQWLLPHMTRRAFKAGEVLFRKGDSAHEVIYIASGEVRLEEDGRILGPGELLGEIGLFSPERKRTMSVVCHSDGELYRMSDEHIYLLYYQNPALGFYFMRLVAQRLFRDLGRATPVPASPAGSSRP